MTRSRRCRQCGGRHQVSQDEKQMYDWELNGFCSYGCQAAWDDACWRYERDYRP